MVFSLLSTLPNTKTMSRNFRAASAFHRRISDTQAEAMTAVNCTPIKKSAKDGYPSHLKKKKRQKASQSPKNVSTQKHEI